MKRIAAALLLMFALVLPAAAVADDHRYSDPAMSFTPPADYFQLAVPAHDPAVFDDPAVVASWVRHPGKADLTQITIRMQNFESDVNAFDTTVENDMRGQGSDVFIKKSNTSLPNGMPAIWQEITTGSGFDQVKIYQYIWSDGVRGVELMISGRYGALDEPAAKRALANVSATAYPRNRE